MGTGAVLVVQLPDYPDNGEINRWRRDLLTAFDPDDFYADGPLRIIRTDDPADIPIPGPGQWLDVGILVKFSDKEYVSRIAEWLEANIPIGKVYWGHDAGDDSLEPFGAD